MTKAQESKKVKVTFCSGAETVTGANFLVEFPDQGVSKKILIDCGLLQGSGEKSHEANREPFLYDPKEIDILFITHAHIDHIGRIPQLINEGFQGKIYSTIPTKDLAQPMLEDAINILAHDTMHGLDKIYTMQNVDQALAHWQGFRYKEELSLGDGLKVRFLDAGHILGSAMIEFVCNKKKIVFTGDLGNSPNPILPDTESITDADYLIMEGVYGDRNHESHEIRRKILEETIEDNAKRKGILMIPTFSLERTQTLLFEIDELIENNRIPLVPFYLDSPLAIRLNYVYHKHTDYLNELAKKQIHSGNDIFVFSGLKPTVEAQDSKMILGMPNPKVIIAGSGMSTGGRIIHHERHYLPDPNNTLLLTGYQTLGTLGRAILDGAKKVMISGEEVLVKAKVVTIEGYSGHKDSDNLLKFVQATEETVKKVFVVMSEPRSSLFLVQKLRDYLGIEAYAPKDGDSIILEC